MAITSYAPELLELFKKAALETVKIPLPLDSENKPRKAIRLRFRLNKLRKELRKAGHELANIANSVQFQIASDGSLIAQPTDIDFVQALKIAGVGAPKLHGTPETIMNTLPDKQLDAIHEFLKEGDDINE